MSFDQFTRWRCPNCGQDGIDSWNKALFDGPQRPVASEAEPLILGMECQRCLWPCAVRYTSADAVPRIIMSPSYQNYAYEDEAFRQLQAGADAGAPLLPTDRRDADWSGGCLAARGQLQ